MLDERLAGPKNKGSFEPKEIGARPNEDISPKEIYVTDIDVIHVQLVGPFFSIHCSQKRYSLGSFTEDCVFSPVLLFGFYVRDELAILESLMELCVRYDTRLGYAESKEGM